MDVTYEGKKHDMVFGDLLYADSAQSNSIPFCMCMGHTLQPVNSRQRYAALAHRIPATAVSHRRTAAQAVCVAALTSNKYRKNKTLLQPVHFL
jgi:hypothetical protein